MPVYFVQAGEGGPIKIGFTGGDVRRRIADLKTACPFPLIPLGSIEGDERRERELHQHFHCERINREWFSPCPELMALIATADPVIALRKNQTPASDVIDAFGGTAEMARIAGVKMPAVSNWRRIGRIPPRLFLRISEAGRARGVEVPSSIFEEVTDAERMAS